ncbi:MAG: hypothetical protein AAGB19_19050 [Cyanobacteria bacterium P01_F01_bin.3]
MTQSTPKESGNQPGGISISGSSGINIVQGKNTVLGNDTQVVSGNNNQVQQSQGATDDTLLTKEDILNLFKELDALIKGFTLPGDAKEEATTYFNAAKTATAKNKPTDTIKTNLITVAETLGEASKTVEAGKPFWETAKPSMETIGKWLGIAVFSALL